MRFYSITFLLLAFYSCKSDKPAPLKLVPYHPGNGVFITNEGNFGWGNASVCYYYNLSDSTVADNIFTEANKRPLGDVCQSMEIFNDRGYLVVNNSSKIEVINPYDFTSIATINNLASPRYFLGINSSKAYVTDYKSNAISVVDLNTNTKVKEIPCRGWTERLMLVDGKAFVTNMRSSYIYLVNTDEDRIEDSILVGYASNSICLDKNGKLWVLCGGDRDKQKLAGLYKISLPDRKVEQFLPFPSATDSPGHLAINNSKEVLYYLNNGVYNIKIIETSLPEVPLISGNTFLFYGLGISPNNGDIFVSDAIDYQQKGIVYRYNSSGKLLSSFHAGIIPGGFYFY